MDFNRKEFLGSMFGLGVAGCVTPFGGDKARLKVGILSDTHIREPEPTCASSVPTLFYGDGFRKDLPTSSETFKHALEYYRDRGADAVLICGDMCDLGTLGQLKTVRRLWNEVFPNDRAPDGRHVERLFITGNHEWQSWNYGCTNKLWPDYNDRRGRAFVSNPAKFWEATFDEKFEPIAIKNVKGYDFLLAHYVDKSGVPELPAFIAKNAGRLRGRKPFFFAQHLHPKGTCSSPFGISDSGFATDALSKFPNAVAFSGHTHYSLADERTIWQGAFTSVGCASLRFTQTCGKADNAAWAPDDATMPPLDSYEARQGMFMTVYDDRIVLEKRDFLHDLSIGDDWVIPVGSNGPRPYAYASRAANEPKPHFPVNAKVESMRAPARYRDGKVYDSFQLKFPVAQPSLGEPRTAIYEVAAKVGETAYPPRYVMSPGTIFGQAADTRRVVSVYPAEKIPAGSVVDFTITPIGCFGARGTPLKYRFDAH